MRDLTLSADDNATYESNLAQIHGLRAQLVHLADDKAQQARAQIDLLCNACDKLLNPDWFDASGKITTLHPRHPNFKRS